MSLPEHLRREILQTSPQEFIDTLPLDLIEEIENNDNFVMLERPPEINPNLQLKR